MQTTDDGEFIPEKELNTSFKIPKRKADDVAKETNEAVHQQDEPSAVLANSYYNYQAQNMALLGPWQQQAPYYAPMQFPNVNTSDYVPDPLAQKIYSTLNEYKEKPKNYKKDVFKETVPDCSDPSLPKELTAMFQPLYCKLCTAQLSSNVMAKLHYKSKNHERKIRKFLIEYSERTGEPLHKRAKVIPMKPINEEDKDPRNFHCEVCDLPLTGKLHAESHYMGKNHHKALLGYKAPAGKGFYNDDGKWVRTHVSTKQLSDGDDTFGLAFRAQPSSEPIVKELVNEPVKAKNAVPTKFQCDVCLISATCLQQLEMHYKGQKHLKKMRQLGLPVGAPVAAPSSESANEPLPGVAMPSSTKSEKNNLSAYRTPSGHYYCQICNLTLNSETQFKTHLQSKNHHKKSAQPAK